MLPHRSVLTFDRDLLPLSSSDLMTEAAPLLNSFNVPNRLHGTRSKKAEIFIKTSKLKYPKFGSEQIVN